MAGRPPKKFDLAELEKLCILQCTIEEVAAFFEVSHDTVQRRMATMLRVSPGPRNPTHPGQRQNWREPTLLPRVRS